MEGKQPNPMWSPEIALRTKEQVLIKDWGTNDQSIASAERFEAPLLVPPMETWTTLRPTAAPNGVTLFYQARSCPPLPTRQELNDVVAENVLDKTGNGHQVCRLGDTVVKYGGDPNVVEETENLLFLAEKRPELRIPTVLAAWSIQSEIDTPIYFLMMNYIDGILIDDEKFALLPIHAQDIVCAKVSSQLRYLRELPSEGYYGRVHGKGWLRPPPGIDTNTAVYHGVTGPYKTYEEYCAATYRCHQSTLAVSIHKPEWWPNYYEFLDEFISIFTGWEPNEPRLTWIDPKFTNTIVRQIQKDDGSEDWEVFLIDWEGLGWYPAWLQGVQLHKRCGIWLRDPMNCYEFHPYRRDEIRPRVMKDFDPEPDQGRLTLIDKHSWRCF